MLISDTSSDDDNSWLIATCPSCSKQIKSKKEVLKSTLSIACPYCQHPLNLRDQEPSRISKPKYSQAEIQKKAPDKGPRKRKNSKKKKIISWDLEDEDDDSDNEIVTALDSSGNKIRKLKRRSKAGNSQSKTYKKITGGSLALLTGGGILLFGAISYKGIRTISRDISSPNITDTSNFPNKISIKPISDFLTINEKEECMNIISSFMEESDKTKIKEFITHPKITIPRILEGTYGPKDETYEGIRDDIKIQIAGKYVILLSVKIANELRSRTFAFEQTQESIKMNWEVSFGYQVMKVKEFIASKTEEPTEFRVSMRLSDYYAHYYRNESKWQCLEISYPNDHTSKTFAYVDKNSILGNKVVTQLTPSASPTLRLNTPKAKTLSAIVKLQQHKNSLEDNQVELVEIIQDHWY